MTKYWILVVLYAGFIFYLSSLTSVGWIGANEPTTPIISLHSIEYSILGILLFLALKNNFSVSKSFILAFLLGSFYGVTDEIHQYFVPQRYCSLEDVLANAIGVFIGCLFVASIYVKLKANR